MNHNLLDKYWEAKTSTQEEEQLLNDMAGSTNPEAGYFAMIAAARKQKSNLTIEDIKAYNQKQQVTSSPVIRPLYRLVASAAAILVFIISGIGLWKYTHQITQPVQMAETFEDPYEAYAEVREALAFVSSKLNKSQGEAMLNIKKAGEYADMFK
jgi:hypothetical protein